MTEFTEKPQIGEGWINGGFLVFEPALFDYLDGDATSLEADALERLAEDRQLAAYRHERLLAVHGHAARQAAARALWADGRSALGGARELPRSGATGRRSSPARPACVGGWTLRRLVEAGRRRRLPRARLGAAAPKPCVGGLLERATVVRGDVRDRALLERALGEYEIDTVIHLAAQTIVGIANRNPVSTFETNIAGTWALLEACRRSPLVKQIVVASSDKAYGDQAELPYARTTPLEGRHPYDVSKSCADLIAHVLRRHLRAAGRDHPLRQLLRRRRPELEPHRARHDPLGAARRAAGHPLGRHVRARLLLRRGRRRGVHAARRVARGESRGPRRGVQLLERDAGDRLELVDADPRR